MKIGDYLRLDSIDTNETGKESFYGHCVGDIGQITSFWTNGSPVVLVAGRESTSHQKPAVVWDNNIAYTNVSRELKLKILELL